MHYQHHLEQGRVREAPHPAKALDSFSNGTPGHVAALPSPVPPGSSRRGRTVQIASSTGFAEEPINPRSPPGCVPRGRSHRDVVLAVQRASRFWKPPGSQEHCRSSRRRSLHRRRARRRSPAASAREACRQAAAFRRQVQERRKPRAARARRGSPPPGLALQPGACTPRRPRPAPGDRTGCPALIERRIESRNLAQQDATTSRRAQCDAWSARACPAPEPRNCSAAMCPCEIERAGGFFGARARACRP